MRIRSSSISRSSRILQLLIVVIIGFATWNIYSFQHQIANNHRNKATKYSRPHDMLRIKIHPDKDFTSISSYAFQSVIRTNESQTCKETRNLAFLKLHKVGGSTVMNVLQRFGEKRNLTFVLNKHGNVYLGWGNTLQPRTLMKPLVTWEYNILVNHVRYNRSVFRKLMPRNTTFVSIIRHPFDVLVSAVEYLMGRGRANGYLEEIPGDDKVLELVWHPLKYEPNDSVDSFTNNRMAYDLGIPPSEFHNRQFIQSYIRQLDADFTLIMLLERFHESLVLMKRYMCWTLQDILYVSKNVNVDKPNRTYTQQDKDKYREWAIADYMLYDYFRERFQVRVTAEGSGFQDELKTFRSIVSYVQFNCMILNNNASVLYFNIRKTNWNESFNVTSLDCELIAMNDMDYIIRLWYWQIDRIKDYYRQVGLR